MLYHFSEDPTITTFTPRPSRLERDCVWAIDEAHAPLYWFPRECPRVALWALPTSTTDDIQRILGTAGARWVLAIESAWVQRLRECSLYVYTFAPEPFVNYTHDSPGTHLAFETVTPLSVEPVGDLLEKHALHPDSELRLTPSLRPLWNALTASTLHFSGIRLRNASSL